MGRPGTGNMTATAAWRSTKTEYDNAMNPEALRAEKQRVMSIHCEWRRLCAGLS
jgi:hypothetical protein